MELRPAAAVATIVLFGCVGAAIAQDCLETGFDTLALCHDPVFADGFESGDTSAWTESME